VLLTALRELAQAGELAGASHETQLHVRIMITEREGDTIREREAWRAAPQRLGAAR
jgi:hypothetical protein